MANLGLADTVDAAEALFEPVGIPWQVVVDHQVRALEVDALTGGVSGQQHLHQRVVPEGFLYLQTLLTTNTAMDDDDGVLTPEQRGDALLQVVECVPMLGKNDQLLVW